MTAAWEPSDYFDIIAPLRWTLPAVLNSPHSGNTIPDDLLKHSRLDAIDLRRSEDRYVDELFGPCVAHGAPLLRAKISRAYIDLNREPYELDPAMFEGRLPPHTNSASPRVISGLGTIPRIVGDGHHIYTGKLQVAEALQRIETIYRPYHKTLAALISHVHDQTGFACLIDCHSMPGTAAGSRSGRTPDIVLGDRHGNACNSEITQVWKQGFEQAGLTVALNHPYPGGFITESFGSPRSGQHALQIELNRTLYLTPNGVNKNNDFNELKNLIERVFEQFAALLTHLDQLIPYYDAAE